MTDRINAILVTLKQDVRGDDVQSILNAISMVKGVLKVDVNVSDANAIIAENRAKFEITQAILDLLK